MVLQQIIYQLLPHHHNTQWVLACRWVSACRIVPTVIFSVCRCAALALPACFSPEVITATYLQSPALLPTCHLVPCASSSVCGVLLCPYHAARRFQPRGGHSHLPPNRHLHCCQLGKTQCGLPCHLVLSVIQACMMCSSALALPTGVAQRPLATYLPTVTRIAARLSGTVPTPETLYIALGITVLPFRLIVCVMLLCPCTAACRFQARSVHSHLPPYCHPNCRTPLRLDTSPF
jgi:hypothetical protein